MAKKTEYQYFCAERKSFDDGIMKNASIGEHLFNVANNDIKPMSWGEFYGTLKKAIKNRKKNHDGADTYIVDPDTWTIVAHVRNVPDEKENPYIERLFKGEVVEISDASIEAAEAIEFLTLKKDHPVHDFQGWVFQLYQPAENGGNPNIFYLKQF